MQPLNKESLYDRCIENNIEKRPEKVALIFKNKEYTFQQLKQEIETYEILYKHQGVQKNDRIIILGKNSDVFIIQVFVCLKLGAIFVPIAENTQDYKLQYILENSNSKYIFHVCENKLLKNLYYDEKKCSMGLKNRKDWGCIIYTSGSTLLPKGVLEPLSSMIYVVEKINESLKNSADDIILVGLPLSFDYGLYQFFLSYSVGATVVLLEEFGLIHKLPYYICKYNVTAIPLVPSVFALLLKCKRMNMVNMNSVRYICSTGDVLQVGLIMEFHRDFPDIDIIPMYGLTECKRVFIMPKNKWEKVMAGSCGVPLDGICIKIENEYGEEVDIEEKGELVIYGKNVMCGYWNNEVETNKRFFLNGIQRGVKSGDIFYQDRDGYYYFCGRKEYYIKRRGIKVSPVEIEMIISKISGVRQCIVVGYSDEIEGEKILVVIVKDRNASLRKEDLCEQLNKLPYEMRPAKIVISKDELPRTSNGKYDRKAIEGFIKNHGIECGRDENECIICK